MAKDALPEQWIRVEAAILYVSPVDRTATDPANKSKCRKELSLREPTFPKPDTERAIAVPMACDATSRPRPTVSPTMTLLMSWLFMLTVECMSSRSPLTSPTPFGRRRSGSWRSGWDGTFTEIFSLRVARIGVLVRLRSMDEEVRRLRKKNSPNLSSNKTRE